MPALVINNSTNIASLDSRIESNLCSGVFYISTSPTIYIGNGVENVLGASVKITNPYGIVIRDYPDTGYDILPPLMADVFSFDVPTQAGNYIYGQYTFSVRMTDADGTEYTVTKSQTICAPNPKDKTKRYGSLSAQLNGVCKDGKVYIIVDTVPAYNNIVSDSQVNDFLLEYPTNTIANLPTVLGNFSTTLFEGIYKFTGTICANYIYGDNISAKVLYNVKREKNIKCVLDEGCIAARLSELNAQVRSDCTDAEKMDTLNTIVQTLRLTKTIEVNANAGFDVSDLIDELEEVLGCVCTCNCDDGAPIINLNPSKDFSVWGCNVIKTTVGLTDSYQIENYEYTVDVSPNGGVLTVTTPTLADCTKTQTFTFSITALYDQVKGQIVNPTEYSYWASILNHAWDTLDTTCIGSPSQWNIWTYAQRTQYLLDFQCNSSCSAEISSNSTSSSASDVTATWSNVAGVYEVAAYLDGILMGVVLYPATSFKFEGAADGSLHEYKLFSKCSNGSIGNLLDGSFTYFGCPSIAVPVVSMSSITGASCPYDLTTLVSALPSGITAEWHTQNNTLASTLVADPSNAADGSYYVFAKNSDGCYSLGVHVTLTCSSATNCSAPQNLLVEAITGGFRIRFQSAAFPPPSNSYTVRRRLKSDPDVSGSYTTIGTPTWNASVNRWEILDALASDNILYTYRAISNCASSSPYVDFDFANLTCPSVTYTPADDSLDYSFSNVGGDVDKYEISIYDISGVSLIHTDTIVPAFPSPITGTFVYVAAGTSYKVRVRVYIGTYYKDCTFATVQTTGGDSYTISYTNNESAVTMELYIGNNYGSPSTLLYSGAYSTDPVTGTDASLPAVNANILFTVGSGKTILSATCNGAAGTPSGNSVSWSGVNGAVVVNFLTD